MTKKQKQEKAKKQLQSAFKEALKAYFDADCGSLNSYDVQIMAGKAFDELIKEHYIIIVEK